MDQNELEEPQEDLVVEITDLDKGGDEESSSRSPRLFTGSWFLSPRYRKQRTIVTATFVALAILVILFSTTPIRQLFMQVSPTTEQSSYYFGLDANPPWGHLSVDGKSVALMSAGAYTLFSLPRGRHILTWRATPFPPQQCVLSAPVKSGSDTCQLTDAAPNLSRSISAYIRFPTNLSTLSTSQRAGLMQAAQAVLDSRRSSETVQVGELYARTSETAGSSSRSCTVLQVAAFCFATAHQLLEATLRLQLDTGTSPDAPCAAGACDSGNQGCRFFCDLPAFVGSNRTLSPAVWQASVPVHLFWQFATLDERLVEENQADTFILGQQNDFEFLLNITWNGKQWDVAPTRQNASLGNNDPVCNAAFGDLDTLAFASNPPDAETQLVPGPTPASGCLIKITLQSGPNANHTPTAAPLTVAYVIQRFGVLLAVNATAHRLWPFLPIADNYAQQLAQQLISKGNSGH